MPFFRQATFCTSLNARNKLSGYKNTIFSSSSLPELDARAEVPWQSHGTGSTLLHEANGDRRRVHPLAESRAPGSEARQYVPIGPDDRQDRRLRTSDQA